ncbi:glycosyltransferase [Streptomyces sp. NPDC048057]|uniref:glycosyltransferase n=1 Tax=Streptomyces sp. NPDC048057 TaxID=3155628 RepID=UPI0033CE9BBF
MTRAPRVLHVITGLGVGGAEHQLRLLLRHLPVRCDVVTLTNPGPVAAGLRADGVRVTDLGMRGNRDLAALPRLTRLIRSGGYDLVHTHLYRACVYGRVAARLAGVRTVVATEHSLGAAEIEGRPLTAGTRALYRATERLGTATVAVSATVAERLAGWGVPGGRIHTVPNGVDADRFRFDAGVRAAVRASLGVPPGAFAVGGVGRLVPGKRFDALVRAVAAVAAGEGREVVLLIAGDGPERGALERLAARLGVADRVRLLGECAQEAGAGGGAPSVAELLGALDLFVSTSVEEAFGLAVVEALAAGLPVLYRTCPAVEDLPPHEAPGARRVEGDDALARALRERVAAGARRSAVAPVVERYAMARTAEQVMDVYRRALAARGRAGRPAPPPGRPREHHHPNPIGRTSR